MGIPEVDRREKSKVAVCRLAILSYRDKKDYGGYDANDLNDCIAFARYELVWGNKFGFDGQDWGGFIKWAEKKLKTFPNTLE